MPSLDKRWSDALRTRCGSSRWVFGARRRRQEPKGAAVTRSTLSVRPSFCHAKHTSARQWEWLGKSLAIPASEVTGGRENRHSTPTIATGHTLTGRPARPSHIEPLRPGGTPKYQQLNRDPVKIESRCEARSRQPTFSHHDCDCC